MTQPSIASAVAHCFAPGARVGAGTAPAALVLAIELGSIGLDHDTRTGTVIFHALGIATLIGGVGALITGVVAILREHDRSSVTILATAIGALLCWFMIIELFVEG